MHDFSAPNLSQVHKPIIEMRRRNQCVRFEASQILHHGRHGESGPRGFNAAIVLLSQATHSRLLFFFKQEHTVNNGNFVLQLNLRERVRYSPTDVLRVAGLALKDDTQTDDRRERRDTRLSQPGCHRRDLE